MEKQLVIQVQTMPRDTNPYGDVFGGFLLSQMDLAGGILARQIAKNRVVTVALDKMAFKAPVFLGDVVKCYATLERIGTTSITILVEAYATRANGEDEKVTEGKFFYVSIDKERRPQKIERT